MGRNIRRSRQWQNAFLISLKQDLKAAGFRLRNSSNGAPFEVLPPDQSSQLNYMRCLRVRQIGSAAEFISRMEASGILNSFGYGAGIKYENVSPIIRFCRSKADHDTFRYCKFFHRIPTTNRVGRQLRALVYDEGQTRPLLMGAFELASGAYTLGSRDLFLNWQDPLKTSIKQAGLKRIMDLSSVLALPPYNFIFGGKLMAALALSDVVEREFKQRYRSSLLGLVATSATGLHCAILNRIGLKPGGLYRRIGATAGYSTLFASARTLSRARGCLSNFVSAPEGEFSVSVRPLYVLREALAACGISPERILRSAFPKGVYMGATSNESIESLRRGRTQRGPSLTTDAITGFWTEKYLTRAIASPMRMAEFRSFRPLGPNSISPTPAYRGFICSG